jgi:two-component system, NtrC family, sensor histidine kinase HydH
MNTDSSVQAPINLTRRFAIASFAVIGVIALLLGWLLSNMLTERLLNREGSVIQDFVQNLLLTDSSAEYFVDPKNPEFLERFERSMKHIENMKEPVRVNAYLPNGTVLWSTDKSLENRQFPTNDELNEALQGMLVVHSGYVKDGRTNKDEHEGLKLHGNYYVESYIPIYPKSGGRVVGVMEFYKISTELNESISAGVMRLWLACLACATGLFASLYWIVSNADKVMRYQQSKLVDAQTLASAVELTSAVAHNLRNPLASIRASAEMLQHTDMQASDGMEHSQDIMQAVDRADRWITELVRISQAPNLTLEPVDLQPLLSECLKEMDSELGLHKVTVVTNAGPPLRVLAHPDMLKQILLSIIANAIDAMASGGQLTVGWRPEGSHALLALSDTGPGIAKEVRHRIFRPFFSTKSGGLGIGLGLVKRMVEQWQGSIQLTPVTPHGTSVELRLPITQ